MAKLACLLCTAIIILSLQSRSSADSDRVEKPQYHNGDTWQFKVVDDGLPARTNAPADGIYTVTFERGRLRFNPPFQLLRVQLFPRDEEPQFVRFPLFVGDNWRYRYSRVADAVTTATTSVIEIKDVTVAAGTFRAFVIERSHKAFRSGGDAGRGDGRLAGSTRFLYFYSPESRSVIKFAWWNTRPQQSREIELINFTPGR